MIYYTLLFVNIFCGAHRGTTLYGHTMQPCFGLPRAWRNTNGSVDSHFIHESLGKTL